MISGNGMTTVTTRTRKPSRRCYRCRRTAPPSVTAAWLARFGRTAAEQALDSIAGRLAAPRTAGKQGALAGQALDSGPRPQAALEPWSGSASGTGRSGAPGNPLPGFRSGDADPVHRFGFEFSVRW